MSYSSERIEELNQLLQGKSLNALDSVGLQKLVALEDEMTQNKDYLNILLDRNILETRELTEKLNRCFEVFVDRASEILGAQACKEIYGFEPGQGIGLVSHEQIQQANVESKSAGANLHIQIDSKNVPRKSALIESLVEQLAGNKAIVLFHSTHQKDSPTELWLSARSRGALDATYSILTHWIAKRGDVAVVVYSEGKNVRFSPEKRISEEAIRSLLESNISHAGDDQYAAPT